MFPTAAQENPQGFDYTAYAKSAPAVVAALRALGTAVDDSGLEKDLTELVKIRVSQLNGCAFCLQLHLNTADRLRMEPGRIDQIAAWRDSDLYSGRERAALAWAEALTRMGQRAVPAPLSAEVREHFSATELAFLTACVGAINAWNRVAGGLRFPPPAPSVRRSSPQTAA